MKKTVLMGLIAASIATPALAQEAGDVLVRVRAVKIDPADKSTADVLPADVVTVSDKTIPEIDFSYFFSPNLAAELVLTYPQKHDVELSGAKIGTLKQLPPTLSLQYHFAPNATFRPYVGAGINYTRISNVDLPAGLDVESSSIGPSIQVGFDYAVSKDLVVNFDLKKVQMRADVTLNGAKLTEVQIDPLLIGLGIGKRF